MTSEKNAPARFGMERAGALLLLLCILLPVACRTESDRAGRSADATGDVDSVPAVRHGPLFVSKQAGFSVRLPYGFGMPEPATPAGKGGNRRESLIIYTAEVGEHAVMLAFTPVSEDGGSEKLALDAARDSALRNIAGRLVHETEREYHGHTGRSIIFTLPLPSGTTALGRIDCYLIEGGLYQVAYISPTREDFESRDVEEYFESFRVVGGWGLPG